ncbi:ABC transporter permease [Paenirhodobacter populi]|uniref:ABC transporter permease n=1 Tax=Paenirhodobacter populi TaxID=2306993 RepID=A0A443IKS6_9RHOB|nr:ABC transporter permease [Sinirhodobacter populi]RWR05771.1 ABC transporter permease [Sinirhodobacter populi]
MALATRISRIDRLTAVLAVPLLAALLLSVLSYRPNRIAPPEPRSLADVFDGGTVSAIITSVVLLTIVLLVQHRPAVRAAIVGLAVIIHVVLLGWGAQILMEGSAPAARVSPGTGFWLGFGALVLLLLDAIARLQPSIRARAALLVATVAALAFVLRSGLLADLSLAAEYRGRSNAFHRATLDHLTLAFGSFLAALIIGLPAGVLIQRRRRLRDPVLNLLTLIQTIPSMALFGVLIVPLAWVAANIPGAASAGIRGIGMAPALIALFLYSLLPIVANTVAGIDAVPRTATEAATGMGMTGAEQLRMVELPLAMPVILAGGRIVLVQNIGLATVGALIGSGGFGTFIFQGIGQTATDLILLGVLPTVALAFLASAIMDLMIAMFRGQSQ